MFRNSALQLRLVAPWLSLPAAVCAGVPSSEPPSASDSSGPAVPAAAFVAPGELHLRFATAAGEAWFAARWPTEGEDLQYRVAQLDVGERPALATDGRPRGARQVQLHSQEAEAPAPRGAFGVRPLYTQPGNPEILQAQLAAIRAARQSDGWAVVGSANFDKLSLRVNGETNFATSDPAFAATLRRDLFERDFARSREITAPPRAGWTTCISDFFADQL